MAGRRGVTTTRNGVKTHKLYLAKYAKLASPFINVKCSGPTPIVFFFVAVVAIFQDPLSWRGERGRSASHDAQLQ